MRFASTAADAVKGASTYAAPASLGAAWSTGNRGKGVGIAVIDTGVSPVDGLAGRLVHGPDLSGEGSTVDTFGHGTVMAGVAAGGGTRPGVAPEATVVAVKVAGRNGAVDVSTMLQAMHWVSAYADQYGIRVLNLSWGTDSTQDPAVDPLNHAVQRLWQQGIVVVVAAGNSGPHAGTITKPADDPMVLTVGAYDDKGDANDRNDTVPAWSSRGPTAAGLAKPDVVAPGRTLVSLRSPGSDVEAANPKALVGAEHIKGSGTSQAAAVVSGLSALVLAQHPDWTPDQVKHALTSTAAPLAVRRPHRAGRRPGPPRRGPDRRPRRRPAGRRPTATGLGSLEAQPRQRSRRGRLPRRCGGHRRSPASSTPPARPGTARSGAGSKWTGSKWTGSKWTGSKWTRPRPGPARAGRAAPGPAATWTGSTLDRRTPGRARSGAARRGPARRGRGSKWTRLDVDRLQVERARRGPARAGRCRRWRVLTHSDDFLTAFWGQNPQGGAYRAGGDQRR